MTIKELFSISQNQNIHFLEKKEFHDLQKSSKSTIALGAFTILFFFSISLAILNKPSKISGSEQTQYNQQEIVEINSPVPYPNFKNNNLSSNSEMFFSSFLNHTTQFKQELYPNYYKKVQPNEFIDLNALNNDFTKKKIASLQNTDANFSFLRERFMEEDIVMSPFKKGIVNVTSKIISVSESSNLISVEILKSYSQNNKEVIFLQLKIFEKDKILEGNFNPSTNLLSTNIK